MKLILNRLFSVVMALLLLASTVSWTVGKHYCMGRLMNVSFFEHAQDCGVGKSMDENTLSLDVEKSSCCTDELIIVEGQDVVKLSFEDIDFDHQVVLIAFAKFYIDFFSTSEDAEVTKECYPPPLLVKNIQLLDEVFLI